MHKYHVISDYGIFSTYLKDKDNVVENNESGNMIRTKPKSSLSDEVGALLEETHSFNNEGHCKTLPCWLMVSKLYLKYLVFPCLSRKKGKEEWKLHCFFCFLPWYVYNLFVVSIQRDNGMFDFNQSKIDELFKNQFKKTAIVWFS